MNRQCRVRIALARTLDVVQLEAVRRVAPDPAGEPRYPLSSLLGTEVAFMNEFEWDKRIISWNGHSDC